MQGMRRETSMREEGEIVRRKIEPRRKTKGKV
jgi:hypothetical protein